MARRGGGGTSKKRTVGLYTSHYYRMARRGDGGAGGGSRARDAEQRAPVGEAGEGPPPLGPTGGGQSHHPLGGVRGANLRHARQGQGHLRGPLQGAHSPIRGVYLSMYIRYTMRYKVCACLRHARQGQGHLRPPLHDLLLGILGVHNVGNTAFWTVVPLMYCTTHP
eukprot:6925471-Pyramimonas_sp.AAC.1